MLREWLKTNKLSAPIKKQLTRRIDARTNDHWRFEDSKLLRGKDVDVSQEEYVSLFKRGKIKDMLSIFTKTSLTVDQDWIFDRYEELLAPLGVDFKATNECIRIASTKNKALNSKIGPSDRRVDEVCEFLRGSSAAVKTAIELNDGHATSLVVDSVSREIVWFDPYGVAPVIEFQRNSTTDDSLAEKYIELFTAKLRECMPELATYALIINRHNLYVKGFLQLCTMFVVEYAALHALGMDHAAAIAKMHENTLDSLWLTYKFYEPKMIDCVKHEFVGSAFGGAFGDVFGGAFGGCQGFGVSFRISLLILLIVLLVVFLILFLCFEQKKREREAPIGIII